MSSLAIALATVLLCHMAPPPFETGRTVVALLTSRASLDGEIRMSRAMIVAEVELVWLGKAQVLHKRAQAPPCLRVF